MEEKALISLNNEFLLNQVKDLLKENGIAYVIRTEGVGSYRRIAHGATSAMTTIYVGDEDLDKALKVIEIIDGIYGNDNDLSDTIPDELKEIEEDKDYNEKYNKKIGLIGNLFVYGIVGLMFLIFFSMLIQYLKNG